MIARNHNQGIIVFPGRLEFFEENPAALIKSHRLAKVVS